MQVFIAQCPHMPKPEKIERNIQIVRKAAQGYSERDIAKLYGIHYSTVHNIIIRYRKLMVGKDSR